MVRHSGYDLGRKLKLTHYRLLNRRIGLLVDRAPEQGYLRPDAHNFNRNNGIAVFPGIICYFRQLTPDDPYLSLHTCALR
jgi:hypothetical protein